jgi:transcriptional regulator of heat shock response
MVALEQEGYLQQPHTSAGRVPTDKGYRYFVDHLSVPGHLDAVRTEEVREFFTSTHRAVEQMLADSSRLLSRLTDYAALVVGPGTEAAQVRSLQLVGLSTRTATAVQSRNLERKSKGRTAVVELQTARSAAMNFTDSPRVAPGLHMDTVDNR